MMIINQKPCNIIGPHPELELKNCRTCGMEWHKSERKPNCPYIETSPQKIERLEAEVIEKDAEIARLKAALGTIADVLDNPLVDYGETLEEMVKIARQAKMKETSDDV